MTYLPFADVIPPLRAAVVAALRAVVPASVPVMAGDVREGFQPPGLVVNMDLLSVGASGVSVVEVRLLLLTTDRQSDGSRASLRAAVQAWVGSVVPCAEVHPLVDALSVAGLYVMAVGVSPAGEGEEEVHRFPATEWRLEVECVRC